MKNGGPEKPSFAAGSDDLGTVHRSLQPSTVNLQSPPIPDHELIRCVGVGSYGEVWLARSAVGTLRAVKIVWRKTFWSDHPFEREFKGIQKFEPISREHEGLVDILQIGRGDGYFYYVMELADAAEPRSVQCSVGQYSVSHAPSAAPITASQLNTDSLTTEYSPRTLDGLLRPNAQLSTHNPQPAAHRLPVAECVHIGLTLASALAHLHKHRLVHRDVKPANVIFVSGAPKLADIGLVTETSEARSYVGTEGFIPPEGPGTPQADLYSLGKLLYEISTGKDRHAFPELPSDLAEQSEAEQLVELNTILLKACQNDVKQRYQTAEEMHAELTLLRGGQSVRGKRAVQYRVSVAKRIALAIVVVAFLLGVLPLVKLFQRGTPAKPEVVSLYELGRYHHSKLTAVDCSNAVWHLNAALQIDPKYVPAYVELFEIYLWTFPGVASTRLEQFQKTREIADKLLAINPKLAEGHASRSYSKYLERDWRGAEEEIGQAIRLNPNYSMGHILYGYYLSLLGRTDEALREMRRGEELDSASSRIAVLVGWYPFMAARQFDRAIAQLKRVVDIDKKFPEAHKNLGWCYEAQSNYLAAIKEYEKYDLLSDEDPAKTTEFYTALQQAFHTNGETGYWQKKLELLLPDENLPEEQVSNREIAACYAKLGQKEKALHVLETHFDEMTLWNALKFDPLLDTLHDERRFKALLKKAGLER